jgi:hypothetical protein
MTLLGIVHFIPEQATMSFGCDKNLNNMALCILCHINIMHTVGCILYYLNFLNTCRSILLNVQILNHHHEMEIIIFDH